MIKPETIASLKRLESVDWFHSVGKKDTANAIVLSSWEEAMISCSSEDWDYLLNEAANQYGEKLRSRSRSRYNQWNAVVNELKPLTTSLVLNKVTPVVATYNLPKIFIDSVNWDILHFAIECEFSDIYPPGFFASQAYWYTAGHFPCGWRGDFPEGVLVVY